MNGSAVDRRRRQGVPRACACLALILLLAPLLTGCWDSIDPKDRAFVTAIGLDAAPNHMLRVTLEVPTPSGLNPNSSQGGNTNASGTPLTFTVSAVAPTFADALFRIQAKLDRLEFFGETTAIVIGKSLAQRGPDTVIRDMIRFPRMDASTYIAVADGDAGQLVSLQTEAGHSAGKVIRGVFQTAAGESRVPDTRLWEAYRSISNFGEDSEMLVMAPDSEAGISLTGAALFATGKLVATLDLGTALDVSMLLGSARMTTFDVQFHGEPVAFNRVASKARIGFEWPSGASLPVFHDDIVVQATLASDPSARHGWDKKDVAELEAAAIQQLSARFTRTWTLVQSSGSDVLLLGLRVYHLDPAGWRRLRWSRDYKRVPLEIHVRVHIVGAGERT